MRTTTDPKRTEGFTLTEFERSVIARVNQERALDNRSLALRHIIREFAQANNIAPTAPAQERTA